MYVEAKETKKNLTVVAILAEIPTRVSRSDKIIIVGGGIIQDIGGFLAGIYKRGIPYILVPTTLLAMTDSCIGSKVCLNHDSKNQLRLFYPPSKIILSTTFLSTLDPALIGGPIAYEEFIRFYHQRNYLAILRQSLLIKKTVIEKDKYERHERKCLNYGHAIEASTGFTIPHWIAVLLGMYFINHKKIFYIWIP